MFESCPKYEANDLSEEGECEFTDKLRVPYDNIAKEYRANPYRNEFNRIICRFTKEGGASKKERRNSEAT